MVGPTGISANYVSDILDEIALEGLDGITTEALWMRLSVRQNFGFKIDENSKQFLWGIIIRMNDVKFYEIPNPRPSLKYYDYTNTEDNHNAVLELDEVYPYCSVKNVPGILGSCQEYFTRVDVTLEVMELPLRKVEAKWGNRLVIVASQESRSFALLGSFCTPNLDLSNVPIHYDILERIGRCRQLGLTTCGKGSIQSVIEDSKTIFHYLKFLIHNKLIMKHSLLGSLHVNSNASQLYLARFFGDVSTENLNILQLAVDELRARPPNYMMPCHEFYDLFDVTKRKRVKKYRKTSIFNKYITVVKNFPYRKIYPNASQSEWERKSKTGEKVISCFKLINPRVQLTEEKECDAEDEDSISGFLPRGIYYKNMPIFAQAYYHIKSSGTLGRTLTEMCNIMGVGKRMMRALIKQLVTKKVCKFYIESEGRRRFKRYIVGEVAQMKAAASELAEILSQDTTAAPEPDAAPKLPQFKEEKNMSYRTLRRIGMIIKTIKAHRFRLFHQITKYVMEEEIKEGLTSKVDRVTIFRILLKLENDELIKTITLTGGKEETGHVVKLYAEPTFELDDNLAQALYHAHTSYHIPEQKESDEGQVNLDQEFSNVLIENLSEMKKMLQGIERGADKANPNIPKGTEIAYSPKFMRLNIIHDLVFHLVYDYTGDVTKSQEELLGDLSKTTAIDEELRKEMPKLYGSQVSTYMFVPPLTHSGKIAGWFLISDLLIRMPLSVMVKVTRIPETCHDLWRYLHHPVRKHFLVKDLPLSIREIFFSGKQPLASFISDLRRLCFIGLVQFGLKFGRQQYQTFAYLNRRASLLDTSTAPPEYFQLPSDLTFQAKYYYFNTKSDVKNYWMDMFNICMATSLGAKKRKLKKSIMIERELSKESLKRYLDPKTVEKAEEDDSGVIPGDNLGAAGLDSALFSHLRSNWTGPISKLNDRPTDKRTRKIPLQRLKRDQKRGKAPLKSARKFVPPRLDLISKEKPRRLKKIKEREVRLKRKRKMPYDEIDLEALNLMNTLRVSWSTAEDNFLLVCRVAMMYLCPNTRTFVRIPWVEVRRVLQFYLPESKNKTQQAIARRIIYMLKNPTTVRSVNLCLEELKEMPEATERFDCYHLLKSIKPSAPNLPELQKQLYDKFRELVAFLKDRFIDSKSLTSGEKNKDLIPDSLEEFLEMFQQDAPPEETVDIKSIRENVIRAIFMSSLSCLADKTSSAVQLFDIYRQYNDDELQSAIKKLHWDKVITIKKRPGASMFKCGSILPLTFSPYKLSFAFQHMLTMKYTHNIYPESFSQVSKLLERREEGEEDEEFEVDLNECNLALFLLASKGFLSFRALIPDQIIALDYGDPSDSTYSKMLERYCKMLSFNSSNTKVVCSSGKIIGRSEDGKTVELGGSRKRKLSESDDGQAKRGRGDEESSEKKLNGDDQRSNNRQEEEEQPAAAEKTTRSSRVILYLMREEAKKDPKNDLGRLAQEFCVVNASKVLCRIRRHDLLTYAADLEPRAVSVITKSIISRSLVPMNLVDEESVLGEQKNENYVEGMKAVLDFVSSKKEWGATVEDLRFNCRHEMLATILDILTKSKIIVKSGINETRYISQKYSTPWLLNSFKMTRLEREKVKPNELTAVALSGDEIPKKKMKGMISSEELKSDEYKPPSCSTENKIKIIIRPWLRIDGSLNRKVLDRFLGTILAFVMSNPGSSMRAIMDKFSPSITPVWTKDLVEILSEVGCVALSVLVIVQKATLFSKSVIHMSDKYTGLEDDDCVLVEAKVDAVATLGLFIGKKSYSKDFLVD